MNFQNWIYHIEESIKDNELNRILDKISNKSNLTDSEQEFLNHYNDLNEDDYKDYSYLTNKDVFTKIQDMISNNKRVICNLLDRNGKIDMEIKSINNESFDDKCFIVLKNDDEIELKDNFLYNIIFDIKKNEYSLQLQDEYFEKLPIKNED